LAAKTQSKGYLMIARQGGGAHMMDLVSGEIKGVTISTNTDPRRMIQVQSYESSHGNASLQKKISEILAMENEPRPMDSQVKYGILAAGEADIYVRIPHPDSLDYKEKIWDHAAGSLIVREAGGVATDIFGRPLDFSTGITLKNNTGVLATVPAVHQQVVDIIKDLF
jgi:3'(2'), 5'-bisphosphate nucleotidase